MSTAILDAPLDALSSRRSRDEREARLAKHAVPDVAPGVFERVDPYTIQVIHQLFPIANRGVAFLSLLLREAEVSRCAEGEECGQEVAMITVQSLRELARRIGWGYDTTHKYVILFCVLGLLTKRRANGNVELHFAFCRYTPPLTLDALDHLIAESRPKVQSYAKKVKRRYLLLYGDQKRTPTPHLAESPIPDLDEAIQHLQQLIEHEPSPATRKALLALLTKLERLRKRLRQSGDLHNGTLPHPQQDGRRFPKTGDSAPTSGMAKGRRSAPTADAEADPHPENGRLLPTTGDSAHTKKPADEHLAPEKSPVVPATTTENGRLLLPTEDSPRPRESANGRLCGGESPIVDVPAKYGRLVPQTGDSTHPSQPEEGRREAKTSPTVSTSTSENGRLDAAKSPASTALDAENGRLVPQTGDSHAGAPTPVGDSGNPSVLNVNVSLESLIKDQLTVNVADVIAFLQTVFHEEPCKRGYYYNLYKQYPRPECWLAAAIETLVGMRQTKMVKHAGRYFYDRCVALHREATLPLQTQAVVAQYAPLSYPQALAALAAPPAHAKPAPRGSEPDQYTAFVARRTQELKAEWEARHPGVNPSPPPAAPDQYAAFVARRTQELRAASAAKGG